MLLPKREFRKVTRNEAFLPRNIRYTLCNLKLWQVMKRRSLERKFDRRGTKSLNQFLCFSRFEDTHAFRSLDGQYRRLIFLVNRLQQQRHG